MARLAELRTRFLYTMNRTDPDTVDHVDEFINAGVRYVERKFLGAEALYARWQDTDSVPTGVGTVPLPACWRPSAELRVYRLPDRAVLIRIPFRYLREPFTDTGNLAIDLRDTSQLGTPAYYALLGRSLAIRPVPSAPVDLEIVGTGYADPLVYPDDESIVTQSAPDAVLYAACREAWMTFGDEPQMTYWENQAKAAIGEWVGDRVHSETLGALVMETPG
jgi:hypothetical protein